ncbi:flavoprotein [Escherichia coli]
MKTLSGIVHSYTDGLLTRAADVVLKSVARARNTIALRPSAFNDSGSRNRCGDYASCSSVYHRPQSLDDVINQTVNRVLDQFAITLPERSLCPLAGRITPLLPCFRAILQPRSS